MKTTRNILLAATGLLTFAVLAFASAAGTPATIYGEVIGTACYLGHDTRGDDHAKCAEMCAKSGIPLAILDAAADILYLPIATDHKNPNDKLMPYIEKKVKVTGTVIEKSGMKGIVIEKIEPAS